MKASIIIPTRNRRKVLERTLKYLFLQDYPQDQYEIIVIDDGSTDGTHKMVKAQESPCRLACACGMRKERDRRWPGTGDPGGPGRGGHLY